jgi:TRAP-type C4-dicarboxylate transport system permease large subunit
MLNELIKTSGINDSFSSWLEQWFGKWKGVMASIFISLIVVFGALTLTECCIVPCI